MTLSWPKIHFTLCLLAFAAVTMAAEPPETRINAALLAVQRAEAMPMRGPAAEMLAQARQQVGLAQEAMTKKKAKDAIKWANEAEAAAELAIARYRFNLLRYEIEAKTSRNTELRRRLLISPSGSGR